MKKQNYGVYFIYCSVDKNSPVKIGMTSDIESRLSALQTGNPYQLFCKAFIPCHDKDQACKLEAFLHNRLKKSRMIGEWFRLDHLNLYKLLNSFSEKQAIPLKKQGCNLVKSTEKRVRKLERQNAELRIKIIDLQDQVEELTQTMIVTGANLYQ